jgi:hypothetical protein
VLAFLKENSQISEFLISGLCNQNQSIQFGKPDCLILDTRLVWPFSLDSSKESQTCPVIFPDLSKLLSNQSLSPKIFSFSLNSLFIIDLCDHEKDLDIYVSLLEYLFINEGSLNFGKAISSENLSSNSCWMILRNLKASYP